DALASVIVHHFDRSSVPTKVEKLSSTELFDLIHQKILLARQVRFDFHLRLVAYREEALLAIEKRKAAIQKHTVYII
ncbi:hypothetical protein, partial [Vibrio cholerae]|uniref:hypothetical protein n=1 Tax=Vibrio cholerae TaxID=666 RepID=UPI001F18F5E1